jgi:succinate dehydrogenase / fumarate reductase cytochrome b subunit
MGTAHGGLDPPPGDRRRDGAGRAAGAAWWLGALASGPEAYAAFAGHAGSWYGLIVLVGLSWAFFNHMASGLRHFVLDIGAGYELTTNKAFSILVPVAGVLLTALFWLTVLWKGLLDG